MPYSIAQWAKYQGRKSRSSNPWVKLHKDLLNSEHLMGLSQTKRLERIGMMASLMLIADDNTGELDFSDEVIAYKLRISTFESDVYIPWFIRYLEHGDPEAHQGSTEGTPEVALESSNSNSSSNSRSNKKNGVEYPEWFEKFWKFWVEHMRNGSKKQEAYKKLVKLIETDELNEGKWKSLFKDWILADEARRRVQFEAEDFQERTPALIVWLNNDRWRDTVVMPLEKPTQAPEQSEYERQQETLRGIADEFNIPHEEIYDAAHKGDTEFTELIEKYSGAKT